MSPTQITKITTSLLLGMAIIFNAAPVPAQEPAPQSASDALPQTGNADESQWPMRISTSDGEITVFQPQLDDFKGDTLWARAAVSVSNSRQPQPLFGAVWFQSRVSTDRVTRTVQTIDV